MAMLWAVACCWEDFKLLGIAPLMAVPKMVGSSNILSSGSRVTGSGVLSLFIVAEQRIIPTWSAASVWSTSKEFGSANSFEKL